MLRGAARSVCKVPNGDGLSISRSQLTVNFCGIFLEKQVGVSPVRMLIVRKGNQQNDIANRKGSERCGANAKAGDTPFDPLRGFGRGKNRVENGSALPEG
jgi:hypothetical protein